LDVILWLIEHHELTLLECEGKVVYKPLRKELGLEQTVVVHANVSLVAITHGVCRLLRAVEPTLHGQTLVRVCIHAHAKAKRAIRALLVNRASGYLFYHGFVIVTMRAIHQEHVRPAAGHDAIGPMNKLANRIANAHKHIVRIRPTKAFVYHRKMFLFGC